MPILWFDDFWEATFELEDVVPRTQSYFRNEFFSLI